MLYMNEWEICENERRYLSHPVLGPATRFLREFAEEVNAHSDGWPYWGPPVHSAASLIRLIQSGNGTEAELKKALSPIKAFMTRRGYAAGMKLPALQLVLPVGGQK